ncbi:hypothetical protein CBR_g6286 [Chara braunii]|uniref:Uncharacterized protein n=1 Tax=Chara braunii TaxID=69332 RepID=A0A388KJB5_CHABU|nr:hypothetical protein CBR_g6286 [Chara braunii]|eukprot:GBG70155.1 hypothetical protein CBR_g6286 [Chara braunii]
MGNACSLNGDHVLSINEAAETLRVVVPPVRCCCCVCFCLFWDESFPLRAIVNVDTMPDEARWNLQRACYFKGNRLGRRTYGQARFAWGGPLYLFSVTDYRQTLGITLEEGQRFSRLIVQVSPWEDPKAVADKLREAAETARKSCHTSEL